MASSSERTRRERARAAADASAKTPLGLISLNQTRLRGCAGGAYKAPRLLAHVVASPNPRLTRWLVTPQGGAAARPRQAQSAANSVPGSSRFAPLQIEDDGDDELANGRHTQVQRAENWLQAPRSRRPLLNTLDPVIVESNRAWIGAH